MSDVPVELVTGIDRAWVQQLSTQQVPIDIYVTRTGRVVRARQVQSQCSAEYVGKYDRRVAMAEFREDVIHVWEGMIR